MYMIWYWKGLFYLISLTGSGSWLWGWGFLLPVYITFSFLTICHTIKPQYNTHWVIYKPILCVPNSPQNQNHSVKPNNSNNTSHFSVLWKWGPLSLWSFRPESHYFILDERITLWIGECLGIMMGECLFESLKTGELLQMGERVLLGTRGYVCWWRGMYAGGSISLGNTNFWKRLNERNV